MFIIRIIVFSFDNEFEDKVLLFLLDEKIEVYRDKIICLGLRRRRSRV